MWAPVKGLVGPYFARRAISPGISFSASLISLRPQSASGDVGDLVRQFRFYLGHEDLLMGRRVGANGPAHDTSVRPRMTEGPYSLAKAALAAATKR